jgi:hypothetical protein
MGDGGGLPETFDLYPPKAEVTGSNPVGRANYFNGLSARPLASSRSREERGKIRAMGLGAVLPNGPLLGRWGIWTRADSGAARFGGSKIYGIKNQLHITLEVYW